MTNLLEQKATGNAGCFQRRVSCNMEIFKTKSLCGQKAEWKHPRWPTGTYCQHHKETLARFWPDGWTRIAANDQKLSHGIVSPGSQPKETTK